MKKNVIILLLIITSISLISLVSAQGCDGSGWKGFAKLSEEKTVCVTCTTCDSINFTATNPDGNVFLLNQNMTQNVSTFCYTFSGGQNSILGTYQIDGYSQLDTPLGLCYDVTLSGKETTIGSHIIVLIFIILAFIGVVWLNIKFNSKEREVLYRKIITEYFKFNGNRTKSNLAYAIMYGIAYAILRMIFVVYYLLYLLFIVVLTEIVSAYGVVSLSTLMPQLLKISLIGLTIIGVVFLAILTEIVFTLIRNIQENLRGVWE